MNGYTDKHENFTAKHAKSAKICFVFLCALRSLGGELIFTFDLGARHWAQMIGFNDLFPASATRLSRYSLRNWLMYGIAHPATN